MKYHSYYSQNTSLPLGVISKYGDSEARSQLLRESGLRCCGEMWLSGYGIVPIYEGTVVLTIDQQNFLCLRKVENE